METINILRLKNGEDIVSYIDQYNKDELILREPMLVIIKPDYKSGQQIIGMDSWLPFQLLKNNEVVLKVSDVLLTMHPNDEFTEFYENTVHNFKSKNSDTESESDLEPTKLTEEEMTMILSAMEQKESICH
jgi:hypothetical protein